jgi:hypothetical protein
MASAHTPDEFFEMVARYLPPDRPVSPKGGRPRVGHRSVIRVIWSMHTIEARLQDISQELTALGGRPTAGPEPGRRPVSGTGPMPTY